MFHCLNSLCAHVLLLVSILLLTWLTKKILPTLRHSEMFSESISTPLIHGFIDSFSFWSPVSWPAVRKMLGDAKNLCNGYGGATADIHELRCLKDVHVHDGLMYTRNSKICLCVFRYLIHIQTCDQHEKIAGNIIHPFIQWKLQQSRRFKWWKIEKLFIHWWVAINTIWKLTHFSVKRSAISLNILKSTIFKTLYRIFIYWNFSHFQIHQVN